MRIQNETFMICWAFIPILSCQQIRAMDAFKIYKQWSDVTNYVMTDVFNVLIWKFGCYFLFVAMFGDLYMWN